MARLRGRVLVLESDGDRRSRLCSALEARQLLPVAAESAHAAAAAIEPDHPTLLIASEQLVDGPSHPLLETLHENGVLAPALYIASTPWRAEELQLRLKSTGVVRVLVAECDVEEISRVADEIHALVESGTAPPPDYTPHPAANSDHEPSGLHTVRLVRTPIRSPIPRVDTLVGTTVGPYCVTKLLGAGGMGSVYLGEHPVIGSRVAIKFLHESASSDAEAVTRFCDEARLANRLCHENIVSILDLGVLPSGRHYLVMEYLEGTTLGRYARRQPLPRQAAIPILLQVCDALHAAHARQIVHRDVKPDNVFVMPRARTFPLVKLVDFGVAKLREAERSLHTVPGSIVGTPRYMSPEQCSARPVDARSDVYSLGVIAFELATGRPPFDETDLQQALVAHLMKRPPDPRELAPHVDDCWAGAILRALEKDPDRRFQDMAEFAAALQDVAEIDGEDVCRTVIRPLPPTEADAEAIFNELISHKPTAPPARVSSTSAWWSIGAACVAAAAVSAAAVIGLSSERAPPPQTRVAEPIVPVHAEAPARVETMVLSPAAPAERPVLEKRPARRAAVETRAFLTLQSRPWGRVEIDGKDTGRYTPLAALELPAGGHRIAITNDKVGKKVEFVVELKAGEKRVESRVLE